VEWISTLCGHGLDPLFDAATRAGIRLIDTRNEHRLRSWRSGFARLTGKPGVCASSSGVAVANALTGVLNAWFDQAPMLYVSGCANVATLGQGCFQDSIKPLSSVQPPKYSELIDSPKDVLAKLDLCLVVCY